MYYLILLLFLFAAPLSAKKSVCLNMIVKDERQVIERCLTSVKGLIDHWVIVDTGSSDGTQEFIRSLMKDIPGELYERPWKNFEYNRNEALELAKDKGDYLLFIDADEKLEYGKEFSLPELDKDYYFIPIRQESTDCLRVFLINTALHWKWYGVLHEELICPEASSFEALSGIVDLAYFKDGHRAEDPEKFLKDIRVLEKAIQEDPANARYVSFLAQTYVCAKQYSLALQWFQKRVGLGGREEEVFRALYQIGCMQELLQEKPEIVINSYCNAYHYRPSRAEPLLRLAQYFYQLNSFLISYLIAQFALTIPVPSDIIHVEYPVYAYQLSFVLANSACQLGKYEEAIQHYEKVLSKPNLPTQARKDAIMNWSITSRLQSVNKSQR